MSDLTMTISGMSCGHCVQAVSGAIGALPGVTGVVVDLESGRVTVAGAGVDRSAVEGAIREAGYEPVG